MSLAFAFYNHHGIVMCADKLVNSYINSSKIVPQSYTEQKLFLIEDKYGLSYTGTASINGVPLSALLETYLVENKISDNSPHDWLISAANYFHNLLQKEENIIFILCGYYDKRQFVITTNTKEPQISSISDTYGVLYSGESKFASHLLNSNVIAFDYAKFTMQDAADFLVFINRTIADMMFFGQYLPTVSKECDVLAIHPDKAYWVKHQILHC